MSNRDLLQKNERSCCNSNKITINQNLDEDALVEELKKLCDKNGKELEPTKSAAIFQQLAKVYQKRQPELITDRMICMIKSAALFNAAIVRSEFSQDIENYLKDLCSQILHEAGAKQKDADLIEQANIVAVEIKKMRDKVNRTLNQLSNIPNDISNEQQKIKLEAEKTIEAELLLKGIARDYKNIMIGLAKFVENVMGKPPCEFSLAGMGSLAREEITPYSDFENMLILEPNHGGYEHLLNYFRWYSVIFQIILINLKETIIPSVFISSLNDKNSKHGDWFFDNITKRGICFDGMMPHACKFPLGRQQLTKAKPWPTELIKPVNEMLKYLNSEESLKNGYHLSTILTKTCHVYGDIKIYKMFEKGVHDLVEQETQETIKESVTKQITEDLEKFAARQSLSTIKPTMQFNLKQVVYRSATILISELGRLHKLSASSCFDVLRELADKSLISNSAKQNLMFAVALACEVRLKWYMQNNKQSDIIDSIETFVSLIGKQATLRYFRIAYALQCDISKRLNLKKLFLYSNPLLLNVSLLHFLKNHIQLQHILLSVKEASRATERYYSFEECLTIMEQHNIIQQEEIPQKFNKQENNFANASILHSLGKFLESLKCFDDAVECYEKALEIFNLFLPEEKLEKETAKQLSASDITNYSKIASIQMDIGCCLLSQRVRIKKAKTYIESSLKNRKALSSNIETDLLVADSLYQLGCCLTFMKETTEALGILEKCLKMRKIISVDITVDLDIATVLHEIGRCYLTANVEDADVALKYLQKALQILENISHGVAIDYILSTTLSGIGRCYFEKNELIKAKHSLEKSLAIRQKFALDIKSDRDFAFTSLWTGRCHFEMNNFSEAKFFFERALHAYNESSLDVTHDHDLADARFWFGRCLVELNNPHQGKEHLEKALQTCLILSQNVATDLELGQKYFWLGQCCFAMKNYEETEVFQKKALQIFENFNSLFDVT